MRWNQTEEGWLSGRMLDLGLSKILYPLLRLVQRLDMTEKLLAGMYSINTFLLSYILHSFFNSLYTNGFFLSLI